VSGYTSVFPGDRGARYPEWQRPSVSSAGKSVVVAPAAYGAAHGSQHPEDHAQNDQDDPDRPEEGDIEDGGDDEADDSEGYQFASSTRWDSGKSLPASAVEKRLGRGVFGSEPAMEGSGRLVSVGATCEGGS
jgi:hypothetical protein